MLITPDLTALICLFEGPILGNIIPTRNFRLEAQSCSTACSKRRAEKRSAFRHFWLPRYRAYPHRPPTLVFRPSTNKLLPPH